MTLPFSPPMEPMLAKLQPELPSGETWRYEPKWDGFRGIVFKDGNELHIESRGSRPLHRYFPELVESLLAALPPACVVDGEIVAPVEGRLEFDVLSQRIHPAASRISMLSEQTPTSFVVFDLLAEGKRDLRSEPLSVRWERLVSVLGDAPTGVDPLLERPPRVVVTPLSHDPEEAWRWLDELEPAGLDGVIAKNEELAYLPGERAMVKVKRKKTADCVVGGYRIHKSGDGVGSLLLGMYDESGALNHVGFVGAFPARQRAALLEKLKPYEGGDAFGPGAGPGGPSRWRQEEREWIPLAPKLVVEVGYDQVTGNRIRHGARFVRWRDDKRPEACTLDQLR